MSAEIYRILDANFNRAREAIRVLEDFARFALNDKNAVVKLKNIRHEIGKLSNAFGNNLVSSRNSVYDVGKRLDEVIKRPRTSDKLLLANFKRLQEALRSIEEYSRALNVDVSNRGQRIRFKTYTVEKSLSAILDKRQRLKDAKLYVLLDQTATVKPLERVAKEAILGGAGILQLRCDFSDRKILTVAKKIRLLTQRYKTIFIVNNRVDIAKAVDADGVHLGKHDLSISKARDILSSHKIIGATTHNLYEAINATRAGADYISVGPMFPSQTKPGVLPKGFAYLKQALKRVVVPIFCIGGIDSTNIKAIVKSGANRVAVCRGVIACDNIRSATKRLNTALR